MTTPVDTSIPGAITGAPYLPGDAVHTEEYGRVIIVRVERIEPARFGRVWNLHAITRSLVYVTVQVDDDGHNWTSGQRVRPADCEEVHG